jgi:hypothetical protein
MQKQNISTSSADAANASAMLQEWLTANGFEEFAQPLAKVQITTLAEVAMVNEDDLKVRKAFYTSRM